MTDKSPKMSLEQLSDDELATQLAEILGVGHPTALRAIQSDDPDLGRSYAVRLLQLRTQHEEGQDTLSSLRRSLRRG
jgi:hypothetical protein